MKTNNNTKRVTCDECGGKIAKKNIDFSLYGVSLGDFPAEVCTKCGEKLFDEETSDRIDAVAKRKGLWGLDVSGHHQFYDWWFG